MTSKRNFMSNFRNNRKTGQSPEDIVGEFQNKRKGLEVETSDFEDVNEDLVIGKTRPSARSTSKIVNVQSHDDILLDDFDDSILVIGDDSEFREEDRVPAYQTAEERELELERELERERERIREEERAKIRREEAEKREIEREENERKAKAKRDREARERKEREEKAEQEERIERERIERERIERERESKEYMFGFESSYSISERTVKPVLSGNKREIKVGVIDIQPIKIPKIHDSEGLISSRIRKIEDRHGISVLPFVITGTLPQVESLADHDIVEIGGEKYSSGTTRVVNQKRLDTYVENIKSCIARGQAFEDSLLERQEVDGQIFDTMKFNIRELETLNSLFINIVMSIFEDETGDIKINVGGYYV